MPKCQYKCTCLFVNIVCVIFKLNISCSTTLHCVYGPTPDGVKLSFSILFYYLKGKQNAIEKEKENRSTMFMQREVKYFIWK